MRSIDIRLCEKFKQERVSRGLSIEQWADMVGVTSKRMVELESGKADNIELDELDKFIECSVDFNKIADQIVMEGCSEDLAEEVIFTSMFPSVPYSYFKSVTSYMSDEERADLLFRAYIGSFDTIGNQLLK